MPRKGVMQKRIQWQIKETKLFSSATSNKE